MLKNTNNYSNSFVLNEKENNSKNCNINEQKSGLHNKYKRFDIEYSKILNNKKNNNFAGKKNAKAPQEMPFQKLKKEEKKENDENTSSEMEILKKIREKNKKFVERKQEIQLQKNSNTNNVNNNNSNINDNIDNNLKKNAEEKELTPEELAEQYLDIESNKISYDYAADIFTSLKEKYEIQKQADFLSKHNILPKLRTKMVDWMIEVLCSYKCNDQTFFRSITLLDHFLGKSQKQKDSSELHLLGVTSMFLICKFEEIYPIKLKIVQDKIAHKKLLANDIKQSESEIITTLDFDLMGVTLFEFVTLFTQFANVKSIMKKHMFAYFKKITCYMAKLIMHDYELINKIDYIELAVTLLFVSFKVIQQIEPEFPLNEKITDIRKFAGVSEENIIKTAKKVLSYAQNFEKSTHLLTI